MASRAGLPRTVIDQDRALEKTSNDSARALIDLRWHWVLDESNPDRVSIKEYARAVGSSATTIGRDAHAHDLMVANPNMAANEARARSYMNVETQAATAAVADTHGMAFGHANRVQRNKVRRVREMARQRAEEKGTSTVDEIPAVAAWMHKAETVDREQAVARKSKHTLRYIRVEASLLKARRYLMDAARESESVGFDTEERELLRETVSHVKRLLNVVDRAIADQYDKSWVSELRVLEGGLAS